MKKKTVLCMVLVAVVLLVTLSGCRQKAYSYSFTQSIDNVVCVEIRKYDYATGATTPLVTLDESTALSLLEDISALDCYKQFGDYPRDDYSDVVVYISYANGAAEVIGIRNTARVDSEGKWWVSSYYFNDAAWCDVILKYIDSEIVPELDKYK